MSLLSRIAVEAARGFGLFAKKGGVTASYLVVAGGGSGGYNPGGGGGAGGYQASTISLSTLVTYSITVGAGGAANGLTGSSQGVGSVGSNSVISGTGLTTITSLGGGYGGAGGSGSTGSGGSGGSGGGGGGAGTVNAGGTGTVGQGNDGGTPAVLSGYWAGGGGGGAGAVGGNAVTTGGIGGVGLASSISGSSVYYAGGGGGSGDTRGVAGGAGGNGGGGLGGGNGTTSVAGTANRGGGGGGGSYNGAISAAGGSGIVIISYASATPLFVGGTLTTSGGNQIHTFTSSGTLSPLTPVTASYLVVAGGAGGGRGNNVNSYAGGGGGAGGYQTSSTTLYSGATYVVTVGAGGAGSTSTSNKGSNGSDSVLSGTGLTTLTSVGGGGGGSFGSGAGANGGSGGGAASPSGAASGGTGTSGQGNAGGSTSGFVNYGAGGGGASATGGNQSGSTSGAGGNGTASSISGSSVTYAGGGGGGGIDNAGTGGSGGGATGGTGSNNGGSGTPNLGAGGGGGANSNGGAGGSGIVIISYAGSQVFNGGLVTSSGGNTIHTFTSTGALTPLTNNVNNSLRFRASASAYLSRTPANASSQTTWTWSAWVKRGTLSSGYPTLFMGGNTQTDSTLSINFDISDTLSIRGYNTLWLNTTQVFRDPSAWYHIVVAMNTTQATAANRIKLYVNGSQVNSFSTTNYPAQNTAFLVNSTTAHTIGYQSAVWGFNYFDGYMADINFIDGQALEPYYFGNNDSNGVWKPILYKGTYGTNGFYLTFGNTTSTTTLGYDSSPNGNNWTTNNISLTAGTTYDAMTDSPTNASSSGTQPVGNYAVLNPLRYGTGSSSTTTISEANLKITCTGNAGSVVGTINIPSSGKWYWEAVVPTQTYNFMMIGVIKNQEALANLNAGVGLLSTGYAVYAYSGQKFNNSVNATYMAVPAQNTVVTVAYDADTGSLYVGAGGSWANGTGSTNQTWANAVAAYTGITGDISPAVSFDTGNCIVNFGQRPFTYTPPTGYQALCTTNLPTPTILQGNKYMDATLYTGNGSSQSVVNAGQFKPDLVWVKSRSAATDHKLTDSVRGVQKGLISDTTGAETTDTNGLTAFNSNGWSLGTDTVYNNNAATYVGWQWQAGQGTTSNITVNQYGSTPSIASTVSVNTTAGFSVVTYTGTGANATVGHGLGVAPKMIIVKCRGAASQWGVYHASVDATPQNYALLLNSTAAKELNSLYWNNTAPTSTLFSLGGSSAGNTSGQTQVAYCFAEISGFSKFGSYTGNGSADGPFIYLGFRPKYVIIKCTNDISHWTIEDTAENPYNVAVNSLYSDTSAAQNTTVMSLDFLSNGFKCRNVLANESNVNGYTYIYAAFAENPFSSNNRAR